VTDRVHLEHPQTFARRRFNQIIFTRLRDRASGEVVCVGNYHMPCVFFVGQVMTIHLAMLMQRMQALAGNDPLVVAGDFNIRPGTDHYAFLATGRMPETSPDYPALLPRDSWRPELTRGYTSAYAAALGQEPAFTNYSVVKNGPLFADTLDYLWLSPHWSVRSVQPVPSADDVGSPLPNERYPSDHLLLAAEVDPSSEGA
jgi:2',5'-phosphodiesterase